MPIFVAHSRNSSAVRAVRRQRRHARVTRVLQVLSIPAIVAMPWAWELNSFLQNMAYWPLLLLISAAVVMSIGAFGASDNLKPHLVLGGDVLRVDRSVLRDYDRLVRKVGTHWNDDELFDFQNSVSMSAKEWRDHYLMSRRG